MDTNAETHYIHTETQHTHTPGRPETVPIQNGSNVSAVSESEQRWCGSGGVDADDNEDDDDDSYDDDDDEDSD